ncbi:MAG TPA: hypothetical protein VJB65_02315 [Patescibacteria group bacterium]|nr:hypothetical protein [Patescibacteria group bacterium]
MDEYTDDQEEWEEKWSEGEDEFASADPFDGLSKRDQDIFFRVLDLLPREQLEYAMDYFMSHPSKIQATIDYVKRKRDLIKNKDLEGLKKLFEQERIVLEKVCVEEQQQNEDGTIVRAEES